MVHYRTDEDIEHVVQQYLQKIGLLHQKRPDLMTVIVKTKIAFPGFEYRRVADEDLPNEDAQWDSENWVLKIRESVFRAMQRGDPRARMTIAHELSHFLLGHEGIRNRSINPKAFERMTREVRHQESEARRCAPILLAPEHLVPEGAGCEEIAEKFGISLEAAMLRAEEIERVRRRARGELRPLPDNVADILREARRRGKELRTQLDD